MKKWIGISLGTLVGLSHIGMIALISQGTKFPKLNLPIGQYTSYNVEAGPEGYRISYRAHDPKIVSNVTDIKKEGGFLGIGSQKKIYTQQQFAYGGTAAGSTAGNISKNAIACIKKKGAGEGPGQLVGGSIGAAAVTSTGMASIPFIGWVLAGATTMFGMNQGAEIGGEIATDFAEECEDINEEDIS